MYRHTFTFLPSPLLQMLLRPEDWSFWFACAHRKLYDRALCSIQKSDCHYATPTAYRNDIKSRCERAQIYGSEVLIPDLEKKKKKVFALPRISVIDPTDPRWLSESLEYIRYLGQNQKSGLAKSTIRKVDPSDNAQPNNRPSAFQHKGLYAMLLCRPHCVFTYHYKQALQFLSSVHMAR